MRKLFLFSVSILSGGFLLSQSPVSDIERKAESDFNYQVVTAIKTENFSFIYNSLITTSERDTINIGKMLTGFSREAVKSVYKESTFSAGWIKKKEGTLLPVFINSWKIGNDEMLTLELWEEKLGDKLFIKRLQFNYKIKTLFTQVEMTVDSINTVIRNAIRDNNSSRIYNLYSSEIKIDTAELAKVVKAYSIALSDSTFLLNQALKEGQSTFPRPNPEQTEGRISYAYNSWNKNYFTEIMVEVMVAETNGKCSIAKLNFASVSKKLPSVSFPGGVIDPMNVIPPPPPPPPR
jgi:hypothetical protein